MELIDVVKKYFDAWNHHDPAAIITIFTESGTYNDPAVSQGLTGPATAEYAGALFAAFPDVSFDMVSTGLVSDQMVVVQWLMRGTNTGPLAGNPPTGRSIVLPGADFITVEGAKVRSVQGYWDYKTFWEQLGLQVIVQPYSIGPLTWGWCLYMQPGKLTKPGAFSLTWIQVRSEEEAREVVEHSRKILLEQMAQMPGFISWLGVVAGHRMFTITAWEDTEAARRMAYSGLHKQAMERFFNPDF